MFLNESSSVFISVSSRFSSFDILDSRSLRLEISYQSKHSIVNTNFLSFHFSSLPCRGLKTAALLMEITSFEQEWTIKKPLLQMKAIDIKGK